MITAKVQNGVVRWFDDQRQIFVNSDGSVDTLSQDLIDRFNGIVPRPTIGVEQARELSNEKLAHDRLHPYKYRNPYKSATLLMNGMWVQEHDGLYYLYDNHDYLPNTSQEYIIVMLMETVNELRLRYDGGLDMRSRIL